MSIAMVVALACALTAPAQESTAASPARREQLQQARSYMQAGRHYEASRIAKRLLEADAHDAEARAVLDQSTQSLHELHREKVAAAREAASLDNATDADRRALADAYYDAGDYDAASKMYGQLSRAAMTRESLLRQARALAWTGHYDDAERIYDDLLREQSTPELQVEYGRLLSWMGASVASVHTLSGAYEAQPNEEAVVALANAKAWNGDRSAAVDLLTDFTTDHPEATEARLLLDEMQQSPELRLERAGRMIDDEPYNLALRVERARLHYDAGRYAAALRDIEFVRQHAKQPIEGLDELERQASARREQEIARLDQRRRALGLAQSMTSSAGPNAAEERLSLAKAYTGHAAYDQAIDLYEEHLRLHPGDRRTRLQYARVLSWDRRYPAAQRQYVMLLREQPDRADLQYEYAQNLSYDAEFVPALRVFHGLTDLSDNPRARLYPDIPARAHYNMGQIYRWYGWNETAVEAQNRALTLDGNYVDAREELTLARMARPSSAYGATYGAFEDSNDLQFRRFDLDGQHWISRRTAIEGSIGRHEFERHGDSAGATSVSAGARHRLEDRLMARGRLGVNLYDGGIGTRPYYGLGVDWFPNIQIRTAFDYNHYDLVYDVFTLASLGADATSEIPGLGDPLDIDDFRGRLNYESGGFWSFLADGSYGFISDDNRRQGFHGLLSFRVLRSPFVAIKADGRWLSYDFRSDRYWSPENYRSLAGVLAIGGDFGDRVFWTLEGKAGKSYERDRSSDIRTYNASLSVPVSDLFDVVGSYSYGRSGRFENLIGGSGNDFTNYWQRRWYVGLRFRRLFGEGDRAASSRYYYDNRVLTGSPVIPPVGETR